MAFLMPATSNDHSPFLGQCPYRLVVRTSRCGRDDPGSTPGEDMAQIHACLPRPTVREEKRKQRKEGERESIEERERV